MAQIRIDTQRVRDVGRQFRSNSDQINDIDNALQSAINSLDTWAWDGRSRADAEPMLDQVRPESDRIAQELDRLGQLLQRVADRFENEDSTAAQNLEGMPWVDFSLVSTAFSIPVSRYSISEQIDMAVEKLKDVKGLTPEEWEKLTKEEKLQVLQKVEDVLAEVQGREPVPLQIDASLQEKGADGAFYRKEPPNGKMYINPARLRDLHGSLDTIAHEGRHAYQWYAVNHEGFHPDPAEVELWKGNYDNYYTIEKHGLRRYFRQPREADAWYYGDKFADKLAPQNPVKEGIEDAVVWIAGQGWVTSVY